MNDTRNRVFVATALAGFVHLVLDGVTSRLAWTTPPYLLLDYANETFRDLLNLDRTAILIAVSVISAGVNGAIAGLFATALEQFRSRTVKLGLSLSGLWIFSGGLMTVVYLSPPPGVVAGSLFSGIPRSFVVAWLVYRLAPRDDEPAPESGHGRGLTDPAGVRTQAARPAQRAGSALRREQRPERPLGADPGGGARPPGRLARLALAPRSFVEPREAVPASGPLRL